MHSHIRVFVILVDQSSFFFKANPMEITETSAIAEVEAIAPAHPPSTTMNYLATDKAFKNTQKSEWHETVIDDYKAQP